MKERLSGRGLSPIIGRKTGNKIRRDAKVHCVMEYLFCQSPAVFISIYREAGKNPDDIGHIISSFESLKLHRIIRHDTRQTGAFQGSNLW